MKQEGLVTSSTSSLKRKVAGIALVVLVLGVSAWLAYARPNMEGLLALGYPGLFLIMLISSASVAFPMPWFLAVMGAGTSFDPFLVALCAGLGSAIGELTGYIAGYGGKTVIEEKNFRVMKKIETWLCRHGFFALVVFAAIPNPAFDAVGVVAGSLSYPARRFLIACILGNTTKYLFLAYLGKTVAGLLG